MKAKLSPSEWFLVIVFGTTIYLAIMAGMWALWGFVLQGLWPDGPQELIDPSFLRFVGAAVLFTWVLTMLGVRK